MDLFCDWRSIYFSKCSLNVSINQIEKNVDKREVKAGLSSLKTKQINTVFHLYLTKKMTETTDHLEKHEYICIYLVTNY